MKILEKLILLKRERTINIKPNKKVRRHWERKEGVIKKRHSMKNKMFSFCKGR